MHKFSFDFCFSFGAFLFSTNFGKFQHRFFVAVVVTSSPSPSPSQSSYCRRRFRVANSTKFIVPRGYPSPSSCPPTVPPWLTHTSATFVNGQNFYLPQDEFVYFSLVFALLLSAFCIHFELFFVNVIIIFPVENVLL